MKSIISRWFTLLIILSACKKSTSEIPQGNSDHQMQATVAVKTATAAAFSAIGNATVFSKRTDPNGDMVITCVGGGSPGLMQITLVNITGAGVYGIGIMGGAGDQYVTGSFNTGNPMGATYEIFYTNAPPPSGTINLEELTAHSVRASFSMTCTGPTGMVQVTNGSMKGTF